MSAWQNPTDQCAECGQDILLRPEVTLDVRIVYARYCPHCDAGEMIVAPRERAASSSNGDPNAFWTTANAEPVRANQASAAVSGATVLAAAGRPSGRRRNGIELWWTGSGGDDPASDGADDGYRRGTEHARTRMEERWAAFGADGAVGDDDEMPGVAEGSFAFGAEDIGQRRKSRFALPLRMRQTA